MHDILILCQNEIRDELTQTFMKLLKGMENVTVLVLGQTVRLGIGAIVIECEDEIPAELLLELNTNTFLMDYVTYPLHHDQKFREYHGSGYRSFRA